MTSDDDGIFTHAAVVRTLPPSIRNDFLPPEEQDYAYICTYPRGHDGFLVAADMERIRRTRRRA